MKMSLVGHCQRETNMKGMSYF